MKPNVLKPGQRMQFFGYTSCRGVNLQNGQLQGLFYVDNNKDNGS